MEYSIQENDSSKFLRITLLKNPIDLMKYFLMEYSTAIYKKRTIEQGGIFFRNLGT